MDWKEPFNQREKPKWMRQQGLVPCGCGICFFCKNNRTTGVQHRPRTQCPEPPAVSDECTWYSVKMREKGSNYCRMCYRNAKKEHGDDENSKQLKKRCNYTTYGCNADPSMSMIFRVT
jgi:hypothetical protein